VLLCCCAGVLLCCCAGVQCARQSSTIATPTVGLYIYVQPQTQL
jgi:hypothetical protein